MRSARVQSEFVLHSLTPVLHYLMFLSWTEDTTTRVSSMQSFPFHFRRFKQTVTCPIDDRVLRRASMQKRLPAPSDASTNNNTWLKLKCSTPRCRLNSFRLRPSSHLGEVHRALRPRGGLGYQLLQFRGCELTKKLEEGDQLLVLLLGCLAGRLFRIFGKPSLVHLGVLGHGLQAEMAQHLWVGKTGIEDKEDNGATQNRIAQYNLLERRLPIFPSGKALEQCTRDPI